MSTYYIGSMAFSDGSDILHYGRKGMHWGKRSFADENDQQKSMYVNSNPAWISVLRRKRARKKQLLAKLSSNGPDREDVGLKKEVVAKRSPTKSQAKKNNSYSGYSSTINNSKKEESSVKRVVSNTTAAPVKKEEKFAKNTKTGKSTSGKRSTGKFTRK